MEYSTYKPRNIKNVINVKKCQNVAKAKKEFPYSHWKEHHSVSNFELLASKLGESISVILSHPVCGTYSQVFTGELKAQGFQGGTVVKNPPADARDADSIPGLGRYPGEGNGNALQLVLPGKFHGQENYSLVRYSP